LNSSKTLSLFAGSNWIADNFVKNRFVIGDRVFFRSREGFLALSLKELFNAFSLIRCIVILILTLGTSLSFFLQFGNPLILSSQELGHVSLKALDLERALELGNLGKAVQIRLTSILCDGETSEDTKFLFLLV
jgi:hypothetical protein